MKLQEAIELAKQGIKVTHEYFADDEYMTMEGNIATFEDGIKVIFDDWYSEQDSLDYGWYKYIEHGVPFDENLYK